MERNKLAKINKLTLEGDVIGFRVDSLNSNKTVDFSIDIYDNHIFKVLRRFKLENIIKGYIITGFVKNGIFITDNEEKVLDLPIDYNIDEILERYFLDLNDKESSSVSDECIVNFINSITDLEDEVYTGSITGSIDPLCSLVSNCDYIVNIYNHIKKTIKGKKADFGVIVDVEEEDLKEYDLDDGISVKFNLNIEGVEDSLKVILDNIRNDSKGLIDCELSCENGVFNFSINMSDSNEHIIESIKETLGTFKGLDGFIRDWYIVEDEKFYIVSIDEEVSKEMLGYKE